MKSVGLPLVHPARERGGYRLLHPLGEGSFGEVYEAASVATGQHVALKSLTRASPDALARFKREFRALEGIHHPNLVSLKALFEEGDRWYIAMELVSGPNLLDWVRAEREPGHDPARSSGLGFDPVRLRSAFFDMAAGLVALHKQGILHRDLKPSNVRISAQGHAVLLDFGLATAVDPERQSIDASARGSIWYAAPEQAGGETIGPAADWYAFGVCLYEALTGTRPYEGDTIFQILLAKHSNRPVAPTKHRPGIPEDLASLCLALLEPEPGKRAGAALALAILESEIRSSSSPDQTLNEGERRSLPSTPPPVTFQGRDAELELLERALSRTHDDVMSVVLVEGESGIGKSALVDELLRRTRMKHPTVSVLRGRCYENELISYKAFDGCIDDLARLLRRLPSAECEALIPARAGLLSELFPVLRGVDALAQAHAEGAPADPSARRLEAFAALSALLSNLAAQRPVIVVIDDLQWADLESFRVLKALVRAPRPPPLLLVCTARPLRELDRDAHQQLRALRALTGVELMQLRGLSMSQARKLAEQLFDDHAAPEPWLRRIAEESQGHPLFIDELVRYARRPEAQLNKILTLDAALAARIARLDAGTLRLMEVIAVGSRPHSAGVLARALPSDDVSIDTAAKTLLAGRLVRRRKDDRLECFHDRIRTVVSDGMDAAHKRHVHRVIADALAAEPMADAAELAHHWDAAGEADKASIAYRKAGNEALRTLAFTRAETLLERALTHAPADDTALRRELLVERAEALARAGKGELAATLYGEAATLVEGDERIRLLVLEAQQLVQSAQVDKGLATQRAALRMLGVNLPEHARGVMASITFDRTLLSVRGVRAKPRAAKLITARDRLELDALRVLGLSLTWTDVLRGALLSARHLRRSLAIGDPGNLAIALAQEGTFRALRAKGEEIPQSALMKEAYALAQQSDDPALRATVALCDGSATMCTHDFATAQRRFATAHELIETRCPGEPWLLINARMMLASNSWLLGEHRRHHTLSEAWLAEANEREDRFAVASLTCLGQGALRHLLSDAPERTEEETNAALASWKQTQVGLLLLGEGYVRCSHGLYVGGDTLQRWLVSNRARINAAPVFGVAFNRAWLAYMTAVAAISSLPNAQGLGNAKASVEGSLKLLRKLNTPLAQCLYKTLEAQALVLMGQQERALTAAHVASVACDQLALHLVGHQIKYLAGQIEAGDGGRERRESALSFFRKQAWQEPWKACTLHVPAARLLEEGHGLSRKREKLIRERYRVLRQLGKGGLGAVWLARDERTGREVALKQLEQAAPDALARFKHEFRALQEVHHPSLVRLDALFEHDGRWLIAMEHVPGRDLLEVTRGTGSCEVVVLREILVQLVGALCVLHEAGFVHREISPQNVRITAEGRAVLLDFGLVQPQRSFLLASGVAAMRYMPPEQIEGAALDGSADVYALGACVYHALTGEPPFEALTVEQLLRGKKEGRPVPPYAWGAPVADDLERLCMRMLERDSKIRPSIASIRSALEPKAPPLGRRGPSWQSLPAVAMGREDIFEGRSDELARLAIAFERSLRHSTRLVLVEGESGLGKTSLVGEFLRRLSSSEHDPLVLRSRCYENEQLAYTAFDAAIDELALWLRRLPLADAEAMTPPRAGLLAQLFPVLGTVSAIASAGRKGLPADPTARKLEAWSALVRLFVNIAKKHPLVIVIDDLQWADAESFGLLRELLSDQELPIFCVATVWPPDDRDPAARGSLVALEGLATTEVIRIAGLPTDESLALARALLGLNEADEDDERVQTLVSESHGHPLFLRELARYVREQGARTTVSLDEALRTRMQRLAPDARTLLESAALAGRPVGAHVLTRMLAREEAASESIASLLSEKFLRARRDQALVCFHDRIRRVALQILEPEREAALGRALAKILEDEPGSDAGECARLWDVGQVPERAAARYVEAGGDAMAALAFTRAQTFFARALELLDNDADQNARLTILNLRGEALARGGMGRDAARTYGAAAELAQGPERIRLRVLQAQQLMQSTQVQEGLAATRALLREVGISVPESKTAALSRIVADRVWLGIRGMHVQPRDTSAHERLELDTLHALNGAFAQVELLKGVALNSRYLRRALALGHRGHAARALASEAAFRSMQRPDQPADYEPLFARAVQLAAENSDPALEAVVPYFRGVAAFFAFDYEAALHLQDAAHTVLETRCAGEPWLRTTVRISLGNVLWMTGEHKRLDEDAERWLREASERDDGYAHAAMCGLGFASLRHLLYDEPDLALGEIARSMQPWPQDTFGMGHMGEMFAISVCWLYVGGSAMHSWYEARRKWHERAFLLKAEGNAIWVAYYRAMGAIMALDAKNGISRSAMFQELERQLRVMAKSRVPHAVAVAGLVKAQLLGLQGARSEAIAVAKTAHDDFARAHATMWTNQMLYLIGALKGEDGRDERVQAESFFRAQGWKNARLGASLTVPAARLFTSE
jgi:serine/threonine protein kinase